MKNFYSDLEKRAFWKSGLVEASPRNIPDLYKKKWNIPRRWNFATAGSCFAQHIARHLKSNGYKVLDAEPAPDGLPAEQHQSFGYSMFSGRYGNIYTCRQLRQLVEEVFSDTPQELLIWEKDGRFYDALRPNIEPNGFASREELVEARTYHLERLKEMFLSVDVFIFTLGLTEAWIHSETGRVVPLAPGVVAGGEHADDYSFVNFSFNDVVADFRAIMSTLKKNRGKALRYILTVSPVPLTATASGNHILAASTYSKSVLRAVAGFLSENNKNIDYFPSYEIITNPVARGAHFAPNMRSVLDDGVEVVMKTFFSEHPPRTAKKDGKGQNHETASKSDDIFCDEEMLEAFGK